MPRPTDRRRTERQRVDLQAQRPVQLQPDRRFLQPGGSDKSVRAARALEEAFRPLSQGYLAYKEDKNAEARSRAMTENAAGGSRNPDDKDNAYNRQWDILDAEYDYHKLAQALPNLLTEAGWEGMPEKDVQGLLTQTMEGLFKGVENMPESAYAQYLAPRLLDLEIKTLTKHRELVLQNTKNEQRQQSAETFDADYNSRYMEWQEGGALGLPPLPDYQSLFTRTGTFLDGTEKKEAFWETIFDTAIRREDPSIIQNVPEYLVGTNGQLIPTGRREMAKEIRMAEYQAETRAAAKAERQARAEEKQLRQVREATNSAISAEIYEMVDPSPRVMQGLLDGTLTREDASALMGMWRSMRDDTIKNEVNFPAIAQLQHDLALHPALVPVSRVHDLLATGAFGRPNSREALALHQKYLDDRRQAVDHAEKMAENPEAKTYLRQFEQTFPIPKDQFGVLKAHPMEIELRARYVGELSRSLMNAGNPGVVFSDYAQRYQEELKLVRAQISSTTPASAARAFREGNFTPEQFKNQVITYGMSYKTFKELYDNNEIDSEEYENILNALAEPE